MNAEFANGSSQPIELVYYTFALSGSATVTLETSAPAGDSADADLDTELYVYEPPSTTSWGKLTRVV